MDSVSHMQKLEDEANTLYPKNVIPIDILSVPSSPKSPSGISIGKVNVANSPTSSLDLENKKRKSVQMYLKNHLTRHLLGHQ